MLANKPEVIWERAEWQGDCLIWNRALQGGGYGYLSIAGRQQVAHRVAYELTKGPIPAGLELDHLCRNRACINPMHLEAVTRSVNDSRGVSRNRLKLYCPQGHVYAGNNLILRRRPKGLVSRRCRACVAISKHDSWVRHQQRLAAVAKATGQDRGQ